MAPKTQRGQKGVPLLAHLLLLAALAFLLLTPAAAFATEVQDTLLAPGTLTLSEDPYSVEEPAPSEDEVSTQGVTAPVQISAPVAEPEPERAALPQPAGNGGESETVVSAEAAVSTSPVPTVTEALATGEDPASTGLAPETDTIADPADKAAATAEPVVPQVAESPAEGASTHQDSIKKLAASAKDETAESTSAVATTTQSDTDPYEPDVVLVTLATMPDLMGAQALAARIGGVSMDATTYNASDGFLRLSITDGSSIDSALARIAKVQGVLSVQPNFLYRHLSSDAITSVNDRWYASQWGLYFSQVPEAWDYVKAEHSIAVAVIDTGADLDHPDLSPNIVATHNSSSASATVEDQLGHGTHVAGIISGVANNTIGVAGVSYNANLVIIKASGYREDSFDTAALVRAFTWLESKDESGLTVAQHYNVRVVNMSVGGIDSFLEANLKDDVLHSAMLKARDEYGILTVTAAGNGKPRELPYYTNPSDSYACIAVMNLGKVTDKSGNFIRVDLSESSNYNPAGSTYKELSAPGTAIHSTYLNGKYALLSGTSMAAPFVAGVAALVFAVNPNLTPTQVQSILEASATDMGDSGWDERFGYGAVNALAAVKLANTAIIQGWKVVSASDFDEQLSASLGAGQGTVDGDWTWSLIGEDDTMYATITDSGLLVGRDAGLVTVRATCTTMAGAQISQTMQVRVVDPQIQGAESVGEGETVTLTTGADDLTWSWLVEDGTGHATIDQEGHLTGVTAGTVTVRAICANNTDIVAEQTIDIAAALPLAA